MSWSIKKKGTPASALEQVKADPGATYMPAEVVTCVEALVAKTPPDGTVKILTYGHFNEGAGQNFGEAHVMISKAEPDVAEEAPAGGQPA